MALGSYKIAFSPDLNALKGIGKTIKNQTSDIPDVKLKSNINSLASEIKSKLSGIKIPSIKIPKIDLSGINNATKILGSFGRSSFSGLLSSMSSLSRMGSNIGSQLTSAFSKMSSIGQSAIGGIGSAFSKVGSIGSSAVSMISSAFSKVGSIAADAASQAISAFQEAGSVIAASIGAGVTALGSQAPEAFKTSDILQGYETALAAAGFGGDLIKKTRNELKEFADQTEYDTNDIINAAGTLASNGVKDFTALTEAMGGFVSTYDLSGNVSESFHQLGYVISQIAAQGRVMTGDWNQIMNAVPTGAGQLRDELQKAGAYVGDFRDALSKGQISSEELFDALNKLGSTDAAQQAARTVDTWSGAVGNMTAAIQGAWVNITDPWKPAITAFIAGPLTDFATNAVSIIGQAVNSIASIVTSSDPFSVKIQTVLGWIQNGVKSAISTIKNGISIALNLLPGILNAVSGIFNDILNFIINILYNINLENIIISIVSLGKKVVISVENIISTVIDVLSRVDWNNVIYTSIAIINPVGIARFIANKLIQAMNLVAKQMRKISRSMGRLGIWFNDYIKQTFTPTGLGNTIAGRFISAMVSIIKSIISGTISFVSKIDFGYIGRIIFNKFLYILNWITSQTGRIQNLGSSMARFINGFFTIQPGQTTSAVQSVLSAITGVFSAIMSGTIALISNIDFTSIAKNILNGLISVSSYIGSKIDSFKSGGAVIGRSFNEYIDTIFTPVNGQSIALRMITSIGSALSAISSGIASLVKEINWSSLTTDALQFIGSLVKTTVASVASIAGPVINAAKDIFISMVSQLAIAIQDIDPQALVNGVISFITSAFNTISTILQTLIPPLFTKIVEIVQTGVQTIFGSGMFENAIPSILDSILSILEQAPQWIASNVAPMVTAIGQSVINALIGAFNWVTDHSALLLNLIAQMNLNILNLINETLYNFFKNGANGEPSLWEKLYDSFSIALDHLTNPDVIASMVQKLLQSIDNMLAIVWNNLPQIVAGIFKIGSAVFVAIYNIIFGTLKGLFDELGREMKEEVAPAMAQLGKQIVDGLKKGLSDAWEGLKDFAKGLANGITDTFKKALGIHSPSKVFRQQIGQQIGAGLGLGITDMASELMDQAQQLSSSLTSAMSISPSVGISTYGVYTGYTASRTGFQGPQVTINQEVTKADDLLDVYLQTKRAATGYFQRGLARV